jgi:hypothetical protein
MDCFCFRTCLISRLLSGLLSTAQRGATAELDEKLAVHILSEILRTGTDTRLHSTFVTNMLCIVSLTVVAAAPLRAPLAADDAVLTLLLHTAESGYFRAAYALGLLAATRTLQFCIVVVTCGMNWMNAAVFLPALVLL